MPEEQETGKKPDTEGGVAKQETEAGGRTRLMVCWNCGALNYIPDNWDWFICWRCGAHYSVR